MIHETAFYHHQRASKLYAGVAKSAQKRTKKYYVNILINV